MNPDTTLTSPQLIIDRDGVPGSTVADLSGFRGLVGDSPAMLELYAHAFTLVHRRTVVVEGETGTGKELVARVLHGLGARPHRPLLRLAGTHLSRSAYRSELERLSPTTTGGTLILDELTELPPAHQEDLFHFLEESALPTPGRSGEGRFVALVQQDLASLVEAGSVLAPLAHSLAGAELTERRLVVPALRHRRQDLPLLVHYFLMVLGERYGREPVTLSDGVWKVFLEHPWSGNVRELRNEIERLMVLAPPGGAVDLHHLSPEMLPTDAAAVDPAEPAGGPPDARLPAAISQDVRRQPVTSDQEVLVCAAAAGQFDGDSHGTVPAPAWSRDPHYPGCRARAEWRSRTLALRPSLAPVEVMRERPRRHGRR